MNDSILPSPGEQQACKVFSEYACNLTFLLAFACCVGKDLVQGSMKTILEGWANCSVKPAVVSVSVTRDCLALHSHPGYQSRAADYAVVRVFEEPPEFKIIINGSTTAVSCQMSSFSTDLCKIVGRNVQCMDQSCGPHGRYIGPMKPW